MEITESFVLCAVEDLPPSQILLLTPKLVVPALPQWQGRIPACVTERKGA